MTKNNPREVLEKVVVKNIMEALRNKGGFWFKTHGDVYQMVGLPDILGCYKGRFIGIEVKRPSRKDSGVSKIQKYVISKIKEAGGIAGVATSVEEAFEIIEEVE